MKKSVSFALVILAIAFVSCRNERNQKNIEESSVTEAVDSMKTELGDEVLVMIDSLAKGCADDTYNIDIPASIASNLSERQKLVKPDYLTDASAAEEMVTLNQKINMLGILIAERPIRAAYDLPLGEVDETIAKLLAEVRHPVNSAGYEGLSASECFERTYASCKQKGMVSYFWKLNGALCSSCMFLISKNTGMFFENIGEEQWKAVVERVRSIQKAVEILAEYDTEMAAVSDQMHFDEIPEDIDSARSYFEN